MKTRSDIATNAAPPLPTPPPGPPAAPPVPHDSGELTQHDLYLFNEGSHFRLYDKLGAHPAHRRRRDGHALRRLGAGGAGMSPSWATSTAGTRAARRCMPHGSSGIWEGFIPGIGPGTPTSITSSRTTTATASIRCDPFAFYHEVPPRTASDRLGPRLHLARSGLDGAGGRQRNSLHGPYVDLRSASRLVDATCREEGNRPLIYREAGAPAGRLRATTWASRTSSSCR